jgi:hypothetical protein
MFRFVRKILSPKDERIERLLETLIEKARVFGLPETDVRNAQEALEHFERGVCFDTVAVQLYEYSIPIDEEFVELAKKAMAEMDIDPKQYSFLEELVEFKA